MLRGMRDFGKTKGAQIFLTTLALAFVGWGVGDYLVDGVNEEAVSVDGKSISVLDLQQVLAQRQQMAAQFLGRQPTQEDMQQLGLADTVVAEAVNRTALRQLAADLGLVPATRQLRDEIAAIPAFQGQNGKFDISRYRQMVGSSGLSVRQFESEMAKDLSVRALTQVVALGSVSGEAMRPLLALENATLGIETLTLNAAGLPSLPAPTEEQTASFYKTNQTLYTTPERRSFSVLWLRGDDLRKSVTVPEKAVEERYEENKDAYAVPERRVVRHILVSSEASATQIKAEAKDLGAFAVLAKAYSEDPGSKDKGGELGEIEEKDVVPSFGKVAFELPLNTVSAPVKSDYGWHLIFVEKIEPKRTRSLAEMKLQIEEELKAAEAEDALQKLAQTVTDAVAGGMPLDKVAASQGLTVDKETLVGADDQQVDPALVQAAFATESGEVSEPIDMGQGSLAYVQVTAVMAAKVPPLAEIKDRVAADARKAMVAQALQQQAESVLQKARAGGSLATAAAQAGVSGTPGTLSAAGMKDIPAWLEQGWLALSQLPDGATLPQPLRNGDDVVLVRLASRTPATPDAATLQSEADGYRQRIQSDVEALLIGHLVKQADIRFNQARLEQVFGAGYKPKLYQPGE